MKVKKIDFGEYKSKSSKIYSGRERGREVRKGLDLDLKDISDEAYIIEIPEDTFTINSSFFLGAFGKSVRKLGKENFNKKYKFESSDIIKKDIKDGIERALKESSVFIDE